MSLKNSLNDKVGMKKVVVLGDTLLNDEQLGVQRFAYEILMEMDKMPLPFNCELLIPEGVNCNISFKQIKVIRYQRLINNFLWRQLSFTKYISKEKAIGVDMTLGLPVLKCNVICLHDCIYENYPADFISLKQRLKRYSYLLRARILVKKVDRVVTVSEFSKRELMKCYNLAENQIQVIYNGWQHLQRFEADESVFDRLKLQKSDYFFALGSGLPHKNIEWILHAAIQYPKEKFIVTGTNRLSNYLLKLKAIEVPNICFTGFLSDCEVKALMENCKAFLHPSIYEGFGIPPLEALSCGAKIIISMASCLPEIYGKSAMYFPPSKYDKLDLEVLSRESTLNKQEVLDRYNWKKSSQQFAALLTDILESKANGKNCI